MSEKRRIDQQGITGRLWQMTDRGSNELTYFTHPIWLPDSSGCVFLSDRSGKREAHLLEWPTGRISSISRGGASAPVIAIGGNSTIFIRGGRIIEQDIAGGMEEELCQLPEARSYGQVGQTCDQNQLVVCCNLREESILAKCPKKGGEPTIFHRDPRRLSHLLPSPKKPEVLSVAWTRWGGGETSQRLWITDLLKGGLNPLYDQPEGELVTHEAWSGDGNWIGFTAGPFDRKPYTFSLRMIDPYREKTITVAEGGNFWHCCPNRDGSMVVADTNWPDEGIKLVDVESGTVDTICLSRSSIDVHPHPRFSPDGGKVAFTSDVSGSSQVFVIELP